MTNEQILEKLLETFPKCKAFIMDGAVRVASGIDAEMPDGLPPFDYWSENWDIYIFAVHKTLHDWVEEQGFHFETVNPECADLYAS